MLLPSSSRDSEDFDEIAEMFAAEGFRVLRPQPRGMCGSTGPMDGLTLHDYARDVAMVIERLAGGPPSSWAMPSASGSAAASRPTIRTACAA